MILFLFPDKLVYYGKGCKTCDFWTLFLSVQRSFELVFCHVDTRDQITASFGITKMINIIKCWIMRRKSAYNEHVIPLEFVLLDNDVLSQFYGNLRLIRQQCISNDEFWKIRKNHEFPIKHVINMDKNVWGPNFQQYAPLFLYFIMLARPTFIIEVFSV